MGSFNISSKKGTASNSTLNNYLQNEKGYDSRKDKSIRFANQTIGKNFLTNFGSSEKTDVSGFPESLFRRRCVQDFSMPFSNEQIEKFVQAPKYVFGKPYNENVRGKNIYACFMYSNVDNQDVVFMFQIVKGTQDNEKNIDFSIKLDMLVSGKAWFVISRLDSIGAGHPNYIVNGKVAKNVKQVEFAQTPHIHINSEEVQVIACDKNCEYTTAKEVPALKALRSRANPTYFKACMDTFAEFFNVKTKINKKIGDSYSYDKYNDLFDKDDVINCSIVGKAKQQINERMMTAKENLEESYGL